MFAKTKNYATFFASDLTNTSRVTYGVVSVSIKVEEPGREGRSSFKYERWNARFVGKAREKALSLTDKTKITITEWSAHPGYNSEKKQCYPYLLITDFEVKEQGNMANPDDRGDGFAVIEEDDGQLPF